MSTKSNITVIVPTINRQNDLSRLLASIAKNTKLPNQLIIVEQGDIKKTEELPEIESLRTKIEDVSIIYSNQASLVRARNVGIEHAHGELIVFLDDDAILARNYFENLIKIANEYKDVKIFAGVFDMPDSSLFSIILNRLIGVIFCVSHPFTSRNIIMPSGHNVLRAYKSKKPIYVEWTSGLNMLVRKEVLNVGLRFYEGFTKYSLGEDAFFTYSVYKKYGKRSILVHPDLKLKHSYSQEGRLHNQQLIKMRIIYKYIFWKKLVKKYRYQSICYVLSEVLLSALYIVQSDNIILSLKNTIKAYTYLLKHKKDILNRKIDYDNFILSEFSR